MNLPDQINPISEQQQKNFPPRINAATFPYISQKENPLTSTAPLPICNWYNQALNASLQKPKNSAK